MENRERTIAEKVIKANGKVLLSNFPREQTVDGCVLATKYYKLFIHKIQTRELLFHTDAIRHWVYGAGLFNNRLVCMISNSKIRSEL